MMAPGVSNCSVIPLIFGTALAAERVHVTIPFQAKRSPPPSLLAPLPDPIPIPGGESPSVRAILPYRQTTLSIVAEL